MDARVIGQFSLAVAAVAFPGCAAEREIQTTKFVANDGGFDAAPIGSDGGVAERDDAIADGSRPDDTDGGKDNELPDSGADAGGCLSTADCAITQWCDPNFRFCNPMGHCLDDAQCAAGHVCNKPARKCECVSNESCVGWPDGKTTCKLDSKTCETPPCDPPCNERCQECVGGACVLRSGVECLDDTDCPTDPFSTWQCDTYECRCYEVIVDECPPCMTRSDCYHGFCGCPDCFCIDNACVAVSCASDDDCVEWCLPGGIGVCELSLCKCLPAETGVCSDCTLDPTFCEPQGMICGTMTKKCTSHCESSSDCVDNYGQAYQCNESYKHCNCSMPSCCAPPCAAPLACDETACTCM